MSQSFFTDRVCSAVLQSALDVVATQHAGNDSSLLERLRGEMQQQSAGYSRTLLQRAPSDRKFSKPDLHAVDGYFDALNPGVTEFTRVLSFLPEVGTAVQTELARYANATVPLAVSAEANQAIASDSGLPELGPAQLLQTFIGMDKRDPRSENKSDRQIIDDLIAQLAPRFTTPLNDQNRMAVLNHESDTRGEESTRPLVDNQTSDQIRLQAETNGDERQLFSDVLQDGGKNRDIFSLHVPYQGHITEGMISSDLTLDRAVDAPANFGAKMAQGNRHTYTADTPANFDRDGGYEIDRGPLSIPATNQPVQDALAAAIEQVERLTTAVKRAVDDLERARGPVQPALPALPLNFGSLRLS